MRLYLAVIVTLLLPSLASAQTRYVPPEKPHPDVPAQARQHGTQPKPADYHSPAKPPKEDHEIRKTAEDENAYPPHNFGAVAMHDDAPFYQIVGDRLEHRNDGNEQVVLWEIDGWYGNDENKLFLETEGEWNEDKDQPGEVSAELMWNHTISSYWDSQLGVRHDFLDGKDDRSFLAAGVQGMPPYLIEADATAYLSENGDPSIKFEAERDFLITQRLILQPRFETEFAFTDVPEYETGVGFTKLKTGLRLRYAISRKFAPYIGVSWERNLGKTANMLQANGEDINKTSFLAGVKLWF